MTVVGHVILRIIGKHYQSEFVFTCDIRNNVYHCPTRTRIEKQLTGRGLSRYKPTVTTVVNYQESPINAVATIEDEILTNLGACIIAGFTRIGNRQVNPLKGILATNGYDSLHGISGICRVLIINLQGPSYDA